MWNGTASVLYQKCNFSTGLWHCCAYTFFINVIQFFLPVTVSKSWVAESRGRIQYMLWHVQWRFRDTLASDTKGMPHCWRSVSCTRVVAEYSFRRLAVAKTGVMCASRERYTRAGRALARVYTVTFHLGLHLY